jgi:predicted nucleotidyltransferase
MEELVGRLAAIPGVVAVALGGSRAAGRERPDSDWDFGLYYRGSIDTDAVRELGYPGTVAEPGEWGRLVNGGAWFVVDGTRVDLLYRDVEVVEHWTAEAEAGRYERDHVEGYLAGMTTYVLAGELAVNRVVHGTLPRPSFPAALAAYAPARWFGSARFSLAVASTQLERGDTTTALGLTVKALVATSQGMLAARREWALNEKWIAERAGLGDFARGVSGGANGLAATIDELRAVTATAEKDHEVGVARG